jgi:hypothetical protein
MAKTDKIDDIVTDASEKKKSTPMTPGQALDWLMGNRGKELQRGDGDRVRMLPGDDAHAERYDSNTSEWKPMPLTEVFGQEFEVAEREMPKLPEGCEWTDVGVDELDDPDRDRYSRHLLAKSKRTRDIYAALVEEFDTRPEEDP